MKRSAEYWIGYRAGLQEAINACGSTMSGFRYRTVAEIGAPLVHAVSEELAFRLRLAQQEDVPEKDFDARKSMKRSK